MYICRSGRAAAAAFTERCEPGRVSAAGRAVDPITELLTKGCAQSHLCSRCHRATPSSPGLNDAGPSPNTPAASARSEPAASGQAGTGLSLLQIPHRDTCPCSEPRASQTWVYLHLPPARPGSALYSHAMLKADVSSASCMLDLTVCVLCTKLS